MTFPDGRLISIVGIVHGNRNNQDELGWKLHDLDEALSTGNNELIIQQTDMLKHAFDKQLDEVRIDADVKWVNKAVRNQSIHDALYDHVSRLLEANQYKFVALETTKKASQSVIEESENLGRVTDNIARSTQPKGWLTVDVIKSIYRMAVGGELAARYARKNLGKSVPKYIGIVESKEIVSRTQRPTCDTINFEEQASAELKRMGMSKSDMEAIFKAYYLIFRPKNFAVPWGKRAALIDKNVRAIIRGSGVRNLSPLQVKVIHDLVWSDSSIESNICGSRRDSLEAKSLMELGESVVYIVGQNHLPPLTKLLTDGCWSQLKGRNIPPPKKREGTVGVK